VRLGDVDDQESRPAPILLVKLVEGGNLPPKRRSGVAAKDQNHGLLLVEERKLNALTLVEF
jgi:hypothetical protein